MVDTINPERRSWLMSRVKGRETNTEKHVRSLLHKRGYRFRKNVSRLPGTPDVVLAKYKVAIFIHGCFWHGHLNCNRSRLPSTRLAYWEMKRKDNLERDERKTKELRKLGWRIAIIWGCAVKNSETINASVNVLIEWILSNEMYIEIP